MQIYPTHPIAPVLGRMDDEREGVGELGKEVRYRAVGFSRKQKSKP